MPATRTRTLVSGRIDLKQLAAPGHSFGGQAATHAFQVDSEIKRA
jgi:hypothetical protein